MDNNNVPPVPYIVYESEMTRNERKNKRLVIVVIVAILLMFLTNLSWLYVWYQYDYASYEAISENNGNASIVGNDGNVCNGEGKVEETNQEER